MNEFEKFLNKYNINPNGCYGNSCYIKKPKGPATNGPCGCFNHLDKVTQLQAKKELWNIKG